MPAVPKRLVITYLNQLITQDLGRDIDGLLCVVATSADAEQAALVFARLRELRLTTSAQSRRSSDHELQRQLQELFRCFPGDIAAGGILVAAAPGSLLDVLVTTDILSNVGRPDAEAIDVAVPTLKARLRAFVKNGIDLILDEDDFDGEQKANLASSIAQVGDAEDIVHLASIIRADIERVRHGTAARIAGDYGSAAQGARWSYSRWNVKAINDLNRSGAAELLVTLLTEPEYVADVASAMARDCVTPSTVSWGRVLNHEHMWAARESRLPPPFWDARRELFADSLAAEAARMIEKSNEGGSVAGLLEIARALATVGGYSSATTVFESLALRGHRDDYLGLEVAEHTLMAGVVLPSGTAIALVDSFVVQKGKWLSDSDRHLLSRLLALLPLVDDPAAGIAKLRDVLSTRELQWFELRDVIGALGYSRSDAATDLLEELMLNPTAFERSQDHLVNALATLDTVRSRELILGFVDPSVPGHVSRRKWQDEQVLAGQLAEQARRKPEVLARLLALTTFELPDESRHVLSKTLCRLATPEALLANLKLVDDASSTAIPRGLWDHLRSTFVAQAANECDSNTIIRGDQACDESRAGLFKMATGGDSRRQRSALEILAQIEIWRLEYGKPADEPRHPDFASGSLWPPLNS